MRADRLTHFKERLRHGSDNFEFSALIDGVSTLDEPAPSELPVAPFVAGPPVVEERVSRTVRQREDLTSPEVLETSDAILPAKDDFRVLPTERESVQATLALAEIAPAAAPANAPLPVTRTNGLRAAISDLLVRLASQTSALGEALSAKDIMASGERLARLNHNLELLHSVDPTGDHARRFEVPGAPPVGRSWPTTTWCVFEFAESPFSGLLPADADQEFVNSVLYASWGVSFE